MKARLPKGYGRPDPNAMMRQVQKMQDDIRAKQEELEAKEYTGTASGEMVTVTMNGKHEITAVKIKPEAVDPDDIEMLEDLVAAAVNATVKQVDETAEAEMGKLTGGHHILRIAQGAVHPAAQGRAVPSGLLLQLAFMQLGTDLARSHIVDDAAVVPQRL